MNRSTVMLLEEAYCAYIGYITVRVANTRRWNSSRLNTMMRSKGISAAIYKYAAVEWSC